jgi:hypothetical protein
MEKTVETPSGHEDSAPDPRHRDRLQLRHRVSAIILAVISVAAGPFLTVVFTSQPQAHTAAAQQFFQTYYNQVTRAGDRELLYRKDLTPEFKESTGSNWESYNQWWKKWRQVDVNQVESDSGNSLGFDVWLRYYPMRGQPLSEEDGFTLVCSGWWASLEARIPAFGCAVKHLEFQSQLFVKVVT